MKILSQRNTLWSMCKIGQTFLKLGRYGCTCTCLSMLSDWAGQWVTPAVIASKNWFNKNGEIIWQKIDIPHLKFAKRVLGYEKDLVDWAIKSPTSACMLEVDGFHWVVPMKKVLGTYWIADPWTGTKKLLWPTYKKITKFVIFNKV